MHPAAPDLSPTPDFDWEGLVALLVHPVKVAIIEAMAWVEEPLSATDLDRIMPGDVGVSLISYHLRRLAELEVIKPVRKQPVRGAIQTFYELTGYSSS